MATHVGHRNRVIDLSSSYVCTKKDTRSCILLSMHEKVKKKFYFLS